MAVFDLLARDANGPGSQVVLLGLVVLDDIDLDVWAEELEAPTELANVVVGAFSGF
jgi:hypothetical protein